MSPLLTRVDVERTSPTTIRVAWTLDGGAAAVDVAHGPTPEVIDHEHAATVAAGTTSVELPGAGPGPLFVSVTVHGHAVARVAGERLVPFEGLHNLRDLGGYAAADGHVRWGRLFRADSLHKLTAGDHERFARLGLRVVYDLRGPRELESHPNPVANLNLPVVGSVPAEEGTEEERRERERAAFEAGGEKLLRDLYVGMLEHSPHLFARFFRGVLAEDGLPALFHCHAGKDRTGVVAALVLLAVGVSDDDVLDDYELTRRYRTLENQQDSYASMIERGVSPEAAAGVLSTPRWAMADMVTALHEVHGGIAAYLTGPVGLAPADLDRLRALLVV